MPRIQLMQMRRGTAATWTSTNPILALGEPGIETDTRKWKVGDGSTVWSGLAYFGPAETTPASDTLVWMPLTTTAIGPGDDVLVFEADGGLVPTLIPL